jgi:hypothetical protein
MPANPQVENTENRKLQTNLFEGSKGRQPKTDEELKAWLASPEGQIAMAFELVSAERWGTTGRA